MAEWRNQSASYDEVSRHEASFMPHAWHEKSVADAAAADCNKRRSS